MGNEWQQFQPGSVKARALRPGDTVGIVAPAGIISPESVEEGVAWLKARGFRTVLGEHLFGRHGYFSGTDEERAADYNAAFANPEIKAVLCARGGYGCMRILDRIDWDLVRDQPKLFCGYSDITVLHAALQRRTGMITFHGPMPAAMGEISYNGPLLQQAMELTMPLGEIPWPKPVEGAPTPVVLRGGVAEGRLVGGNLTLLCALMGTPWEPDFTGRILVVEDLHEVPYRVDRQLVQLLLAGKLQRVAGIVFGDSPTCMGPDGTKNVVTLMDVLRDLLVPLGVPVVYGFPCGHSPYRATLPLGALARLDADAAALSLMEAALV